MFTNNPLLKVFNTHNYIPAAKDPLKPCDSIYFSSILITSTSEHTTATMQLSYFDF